MCRVFSHPLLVQNPTLYALLAPLGQDKFFWTAVRSRDWNTLLERNLARFLKITNKENLFIYLFIISTIWLWRQITWAIRRSCPGVSVLDSKLLKSMYSEFGFTLLVRNQRLRAQAGVWAGSPCDQWWQQHWLGQNFPCFAVVPSRLFATPWTAACQVPLSFTISRSLLRFMSVESVTLSNHLILCCPFLLYPSSFPSIRVFSKELALSNVPHFLSAFILLTDFISSS